MRFLGVCQVMKEEEMKNIAHGENGRNPSIFDFLRSKSEFEYPTEDVKVYASTISKAIQAINLEQTEHTPIWMVSKLFQNLTKLYNTASCLVYMDNGMNVNDDFTQIESLDLP